jgi:hypothetical protein
MVAVGASLEGGRVESAAQQVTSAGVATAGWRVAVAKRGNKSGSSRSCRSSSRSMWLAVRYGGSLLPLSGWMR